MSFHCYISKPIRHEKYKLVEKEFIKRNLQGAQMMIMPFGPVSVVGSMGRRKGGGGGIVEWWLMW
jgi:hypothetical protein